MGTEFACWPRICELQMANNGQNETMASENENNEVTTGRKRKQNEKLTERVFATEFVDDGNDGRQAHTLHFAVLIALFTGLFA